MAVLIENAQNVVKVDEKINYLLTRAVELSLETEGFFRPAEVSILLVDNETIRGINREHRNIDKPTDVLSFPMVDMSDGRIICDDGDIDMDRGVLMLGDIVISLEKAAEQAETYGHSFERELAFLAVHGMFHLLGYDHEGCEEGGKEKIMMEKQEAVMEKMGLKRL